MRPVGKNPKLMGGVKPPQRWQDGGNWESHPKIPESPPQRPSGGVFDTSDPIDRLIMDGHLQKRPGL